jgi:hypothetical protein
VTKEIENVQVEDMQTSILSLRTEMLGQDKQAPQSALDASQSENPLQAHQQSPQKL